MTKGVRTHGTRATYVTGCRCLPCTRANRKYSRDRRQKNMENRELVDGRWITLAPNAKHGSYSTYTNRGCQCEPCMNAYKEWFRYKPLREARKLLAEKQANNEGPPL